MVKPDDCLVPQCTQVGSLRHCGARTGSPHETGHTAGEGQPDTARTLLVARCPCNGLGGDWAGVGLTQPWVWTAREWSVCEHRGPGRVTHRDGVTTAAGRGRRPVPDDNPRTSRVSVQRPAQTPGPGPSTMAAYTKLQEFVRPQSITNG